MSRYRWADEMTPPEPRRASPVAITRFGYEVDPALMQEFVTQQTIPNWDTLRLVDARTGHLEWMHQLFASGVVSGQALLDELVSEE